MKKMRFIILLAGFFLTLFVLVGHSHALEWTLNCEILGGSACDSSSGFDWGTVSLTDTTYNGMDAVTIVVDLVDTTFPDDPHKIQEINLNFDGTPSGDIMSLANYDVEVSIDEIKPDGYAGRLDIMIPDGGNLGFEPYVDTLYLDGMNLTASQFDVLDTLNQIYAAVHIGNYGGSPGTAGGDSIWTGAGPTPVPELQTIYLLGMTVAGLVVSRRKMKG